MNAELLRIVDTLHRDKNIDKETVFTGIENALLQAAKKHYSEEDDIVISIDRESGDIGATHNGSVISPQLLGRISAQMAKQIMIQKIREAERDAVFNDFSSRQSDIVHGTVQRHEGGAILVNLGKTEAILPRSEQIPGETHRIGERIRAVILDVRKTNQRVKIILSRTHPDFVRRLFELEIPEINERIIEVKNLAREAGYRSKVAVVSIDSKVDCVGACVGVRGSRIKNIVDELHNERIDIVRWNESLQIMIPNALQPAEIEDVMIFPMLGRAIVLVKEDQLSLAIGRRGQNVRLASKLAEYDLEIMTADELDEQIERATGWFADIPGVDENLVDQFVEQGFLSYDDLSIMDPEELGKLDGLDPAAATVIIDYAEEVAEVVAAQQAEAAKIKAAEKAAAEKAAAEAAIAEAAEKAAAEAAAAEAQDADGEQVDEVPSDEVPDETVGGEDESSDPASDQVEEPAASEERTES